MNSRVKPTVAQDKPSLVPVGPGENSVHCNRSAVECTIRPLQCDWGFGNIQNLYTARRSWRTQHIQHSFCLYAAYGTLYYTLVFSSLCERYVYEIQNSTVNFYARIRHHVPVSYHHSIVSPDVSDVQHFFRFGVTAQRLIVIHRSFISFLKSFDESWFTCENQIKW